MERGFCRQLRQETTAAAHTHTHTAAGDISFNPEYPWIDTMQLRCTTPLADCVCICVRVPVLFIVGVSDIVLSFAEHCGRLILDLVETIEYCRSGGRRGGRGYGRARAFLSLSLSSLCVRDRVCLDIITSPLYHFFQIVACFILKYLYLSAALNFLKLSQQLFPQRNQMKHRARCSSLFRL